MKIFNKVTAQEQDIRDNTNLVVQYYHYHKNTLYWLHTYSGGKIRLISSTGGLCSEKISGLKETRKVPPAVVDFVEPIPR